jgi:hypothetical protein
MFEMKKSLAILVLAASPAFAQMAGTNYVTVVLDRANGVFMPGSAAEFVTNNASIQNLQAAIANEAQIRSEADIEESQARISGDLKLEDDTRFSLGGGALFPYFTRVSGTTTNRVNVKVEESNPWKLGSIIAVESWSNTVNVVDTSNAEFTDTRNESGDSAEPHFVDTDTMVYSVGIPDGLGYGDDLPEYTGFWWKDIKNPRQPGGWAFALGSYTNEVPVSIPNSAEQRDWVFVSETDDAVLRKKINDDLEALALDSTKSSAQFSGSFSTPSSIARRTDFWAYDMDLTCVSPRFLKNDGSVRNIRHTAITRRHIIGANHFKIGVGGGQLMFFDNQNNVYTRRVVNGQQIGKTDLWVGMLDEDLPESIEPARIFHPDDWDKLAIMYPEDKYWPLRDDGLKSGAERHSRVASICMVQGSPRFTWFRIDYIPGYYNKVGTNTSSVVTYTNDLGNFCTSPLYGPSQNPDNYSFVGGDSGSPTLLWVDGQTVVVQTMTSAGGGGANVTYLANDVQDLIRSWGGTTELNLYWCDLNDWPHLSIEELQEQGEDQ